MAPSKPPVSSSFKRPYASRRKRNAARSVNNKKSNKLLLRVLLALFVLLVAALLAVFLGLEQTVTTGERAGKAVGMPLLAQPLFV